MSFLTDNLEMYNFEPVLNQLTEVRVYKIKEPFPPKRYRLVGDLGVLELARAGITPDNEQIQAVGQVGQMIGLNPMSVQMGFRLGMLCAGNNLKLRQIKHELTDAETAELSAKYSEHQAESARDFALKMEELAKKQRDAAKGDRDRMEGLV